MKKLSTFWAKGYLYILVAALLVFVFIIDPHVGMYDWGKEIAYFDYIKISFTQYHSLPIILWNAQGLSGYPAIKQSIFFLANPETFLFSPFSLLLFIFDTLSFMKLLVLVFFILGIIGIFFLKNRLEWDDFQFRTYAALFLFSPIIIQHIAIGYFPWLNLFLFPWLIYFLFEDNLLRSALGISIVLTLILLQGGIHPFIWFGIFFGFFILVKLVLKPKFRQVILLALVVALVISLGAVRLFTSSQAFSDFQQKFFNGYSIVGFIRWSLIPPVFTPKSMDDIEQFIEGYDNGVPFWDGETFWGFELIFAVIFFIGIFFKQFRENITENPKNLKTILALAFASLLITFLSFGNIYENLISFITGVIKSPILESAEKYPFRFAIMGYFGFSVVIAHSISTLYSMVQKPINKFSSFLKKRSRIEPKKPSKLSKLAFIFLLLLTLIYLSSLFFSQAFKDWIEPIVRSSYDGEGNSWLTSMMVNRSMIPVEAYVQKAITLYMLLQNLLLIFLLMCWITYTFLFYQTQLSSSLQQPIIFVKNHINLLLELLLVIPLIFSSVMWLRVALATPPSSFPNFDFISPQVQIKPADAQVQIRVQPGDLIIQQTSSVLIQEILLNQIKFNDSRFLQINPRSETFNSDNGLLSIQPENNSPIVISIRDESYLPALLISLFSWLVVFSFGIKEIFLTRK